MKHCELLQKDLFAYLEQELPPDRIKHLDHHISECEECNRILAEFRSMMALMDEQKSIEPRPFAETRIMQGIESRLEKQQKSASSVFVRILQPALISFGVAAALVIGFFIGSDFADTHSQYTQNDQMIEDVRTDLNVPEFMTDDLFHFTE
jgi:anti-sigma factor RsiW